MVMKQTHPVPACNVIRNGLRRDRLVKLGVTCALASVVCVIVLQQTSLRMHLAFKLPFRSLTDSKVCRNGSSASVLPRGTAFSAPPRQLWQPTPQTCPEDFCPLTASPSTAPSKNRQPRARVVTSAMETVTAESNGKVGKEHWWKCDEQLWQDVHTEEEFRAAVGTGDKLVLVDFFATWCHSCEAAYPEICKIARDDKMKKNFKFVKVCIDELKTMAKGEGVKALPVVHVYKPGEGKLVAIDVPPSKVKHLKHNLQLLLLNPGKSYKVDPNGFVIPMTKTAEDQAAADAEKQRKEVEGLSTSTGSLFDHLRGFLQTETASTAAANVPKPKPAAAPTNHKLLLDKQMFLRQHGSEYGYDGRIDELYPKEVGCRMGPNEHYMDYTGSSVYCQSQLDAVFEELRTKMFGNPHSGNPSSTLSSEKVEEVRTLILRYFNADPMEYQVVFTRSATGALRLVGETFPWGNKSMFRYLRENHNSVLGIREYALQHGGAFQALDEPAVEDWLHSSETTADEGSEDAPTFNLFAFPPEDNFAGVKYPQRWVPEIQAKSTATQKWMVLMDAAAYVPTQPLDLSKVNPDFVSLSFYKMFGYPTGVGALLARVDAINSLKTIFWGGGTVALVTASDDFHVLKCRPGDKLEDGTVPFLDIVALRHGFELITKLGGIQRIQSHVACLTEWLYNHLFQLRHGNGRPVVAIFGKHNLPYHREVQGGIVNFEVLQPDGSVFSYKTFEKEAAEAGFHVRTGAECNPGACYNYLGVAEKEVESLAGTKEGCEDDVEFITVQRPDAPQRFINSSAHLQPLMRSAVGLGHPAEVAMKWVQVPLGSVRVSLGYMSTFEDVHAFVDFVKTRYTDRKEASVAQ